MAAYQYDPVRSTNDEIRLLKLHPGQRESPIHVTLKTVTLKSSSIPKYEALSYAWGSTYDRKQIFINKDTLAVTQSLATLLPYLRYPDQERTLWIDAICINQEDMAERSAQVTRMADIYSLAAQVIIWLGPKSEDSNIALEQLRTISSKIHFDSILQTITAASSEDVGWITRNVHSLLSHQSLTAISALLQRSWFERLWVVQEIGLAPKHHTWIFCGSENIPWDDFYAATSYLRLTGAFPPDSPLGIRLELIRCLGYLISTYSSLRGTLHRTEYSKCSDPRDRIYAILSISNKEVKITPDYNKSKREVYQDVVMQNLLQSGMLRLLTACELSNDTKSELPSWVRDWERKNMCKWFLHLNACGEGYADARLVEGGVLEAVGVTCADVQDTADLRIEGARDENATREMLRKLVPENTGNDRYVGGGDVLSAYVRTVCAGEYSDMALPRREEQLHFEECRHVMKALLAGEDHGMPDLELRFLRLVRSYAKNRCLFKTKNGYIGLAPSTVQEGDKVCVLLGCTSPLIFRPKIGDPGAKQSFAIVGECYIPGLVSSEAILGPFEDGWCRGYKYNRGTGEWWDVYLNRRTGHIQIEDPRLGKLPEGWIRKSHDKEYAWHWYVRVDEQDQVEEMPQNKWREDPRMKTEALKERGADLKVFRLV